MTESAEKKARTTEFEGNVIFLPLNRKQCLVGGAASFGPALVPACVFDSGCTTLLLPWPRNPDVELKDFFEPGADMKYVKIVKIGAGVNSRHACLTITSRNPLVKFPVRIQNFDAGEVGLLRFVVTAEAEQWLMQKGVAGLPADAAHIHAKNRAYALVGQNLLRGLISMQFTVQGMLVFKPQLLPLLPGPDDLVQIVDRLMAATTNSEYYDANLKDLEERHEDLDGDYLDGDDDEGCGCGKRFGWLGHESE
jgi:hypothetical protein